MSLTPPLGGAAQAATYLGPNQDDIITRGGDQYVNNALGIGIKTYSDATVSYFTRDNNGAVLAERAPGGAKYYFIPDGLGSTVATTGTNGAVANSYKYDPYGSVVTENETSIRPTSFRFAGGLYSSSVGLHKFGARWYDQALDRWTQQDPIDQTGDLQNGNRYLYVGGNPTNLRDPSGRVAKLCDDEGCKGLCGWHECTGDSPKPLSGLERAILGCYKGAFFGGIGEAVTSPKSIPVKPGRIGAAGCISGAVEGAAGG